LQTFIDKFSAFAGKLAGKQVQQAAA